MMILLYIKIYTHYYTFNRLGNTTPRGIVAALSKYLTGSYCSIRVIYIDLVLLSCLGCLSGKQGRPEKLRGPGQRVKVGPFTQVVR